MTRFRRGGGTSNSSGMPSRACLLLSGLLCCAGVLAVMAMSTFQSITRPRPAVYTPGADAATLLAPAGDHNPVPPAAAGDLMAAASGGTRLGSSLRAGAASGAVQCPPAPAPPPCPEPEPCPAPAACPPPPPPPTCPEPPPPPPCPPPPAPAPAACGTVLTSRRAWLVMGIPSAPRLGNKPYLLHTLDYVLQQLPAPGLGSPLEGMVKIVVMNNAHGRAHPVFDEAVDKYSKDPKGVYVEFHVNDKPPGDSLRKSGNANVPGPKVRQQTRDVAELLDLAADRGVYYMFMEDDFRLCPNAMAALQYLVDKANRLDPNWIVLRVCYGLNGAVIHSSDATTLAAYYRKHVARRPPDHMLVEWYAAETTESRSYVGNRPHVTFRHNLLEHFGTVSSLRSQRMGQFAGCYDLMDAGVLFEVEAFDTSRCGHDDITPCGPASAAAASPAIPWQPLRSSIKRVKHDY